MDTELAKAHVVATCCGFFDRCPDPADEKVLDYDEAEGYALISGGAPTLPAEAGCQSTTVLNPKLTPH